MSRQVGGLTGMAVLVFELGKVMAAGQANYMCRWLVVIEGITGNDGTFQGLRVFTRILFSPGGLLGAVDSLCSAKTFRV